MRNDISFKPKITSHGSWIEMKCGICNTVFWVPPSRATEKRFQKYCSRKCRDVATSNLLKGIFGEEARGFKHGKFTSKRGYNHVLVSDIHGKKKDRYPMEQKLIAEKVLGRKLNFGEVVHHIDCNKKNNKNSNLLICSRGYHSWLHWRMSEEYGKKVLGGDYHSNLEYG